MPTSTPSQPRRGSVRSRLARTDPGTPPSATPGQFMWWLARRQRRTLAAGVVWGSLWMGAQALLPFALGRAVDDGIAAGDLRALWLWVGALALLGVVQAGAGIMRHRAAVWNWVQAALTSSQAVGHHVTRVGAAMPQRLPTGEVVATVATDAIRLGDVYDITARFVGALVSYAVVAALLLRTSVTLGLVVLLGVPAVAAVLGLVVRPLHARQKEQREVAGRLTTLGADTVAGLRVLRGVGGEREFLRRYTASSQEVRRAGVGVAGVQATLDSLQVLLPGAFVVLVTWLGARFAIDGRIGPGDLVAFYGYAIFLVLPLRTATEMLEKYVRARVAAERIIAVLQVRPSMADPRVPSPSPGPSPDLVDPRSGLRVPAGALVAVVGADPADGAALADRLGRLSADDGTAPLLGGVPLTDLAVAEVRQRVVVADSDPRLFTGRLRRELDPGSTRTVAEVQMAVETASALDVLESLPRGLDDEVTERGRSFSGGQRQRLALVRALLADAETLVLVEPTSAVDAHTEAAIAANLREARRGRTTVVVTSSPLLLDRVDEVALLVAGSVVAQAPHRELLHADGEVGRIYRRTVTRGEEE